MQRISRQQSSSRHWLLVLGMALLLFGVAVFSYWPTLNLPLLYDDLLHIRIAKGLNLANVWLPTEAFGFYRPLTFLPLLIIERLFGTYPASLLHGLNVAQHAAGAILLAWLSWRLWHRFHWALAAGLLLTLFPFSYQAVAVYGHNVHPATAGLILLGLHAYLSAVRASQYRTVWWLATTLLFILALLSHESAVLFGAFAALVHWNNAGRILPPDMSRTVRGALGIWRQPWAIYLAAGVLYLIGYQFLPISRAPQTTFSGGILWSKVLYLLQAAAYPLTWFGNIVPSVAAAAIVLIGLFLMLGLTVWSARNPSNRLPLLMGWGWWGLASVLIAIPLSATYLLHGPRLLYLGSVGLAMLWPVLLDPVYGRPRVGRLLWMAALVIVLATSWLFVRDRLQAYAQLTSPVSVVASAMTGQPAGEGVVLVNLPQWLAPPDNTYPVGVEFVAMLGDYLFAEELIAANLGQDRPVMAVKVPDLLSDPSYGYAIHEEAASNTIDGQWTPAGSTVFITSYAEPAPLTRFSGRLVPGLASAEVVATIGPYELLSAEAAICADVVRLTTKWRPITNSGSANVIGPTTSIFAQMLNEDGELAAQADGPALGLRPDLLKIPPGWQMTDVRELRIGDDRPGEMLIGVYDFVSGDRSPAQDSDDNDLPDNALRVPLSECPS